MRCLVKSSRASGGLYNACGRCAYGRDVCELGEIETGSLSDGNELL